MAFGDPRRVTKESTVLELDAYWAVGAGLGNCFIDDHRDFAQRILNVRLVGLGIRESVDLQFAVEKGEGDDVVDGEFSSQAGFDFGMIVTLIAHRRNADLHLRNVSEANVVLTLQVQCSVGGEKLRRAAGMKFEAETRGLYKIGLAEM